MLVAFRGNPNLQSKKAQLVLTGLSVAQANPYCAPTLTHQTTYWFHPETGSGVTSQLCFLAHMLPAIPETTLEASE